MKKNSADPLSSRARHAPWLSFGKRLIFSLIPLAALLLTGETVLRLANFRYSDTPMLVLSQPETTSRLKGPEIVQRLPGNNIVKDRVLFWIPKLYWEDQYPVKKDPAVERIITLGCSCTHMCEEGHSYGNYMQELLDARVPGKNQVINAGCSGYSSYQGLQQLKHKVLKYKPDVVTLYFGWNDHWFASKPDRLVTTKADWQIDLINFLERFRVYQAYHRAIARLKEITLNSRNLIPTFRVSQNEYRKNLEAMIDLCRANGIRPVLITAPFDPEQLARRHAPSLYFGFWSSENLIKTHKAYNAIVRQLGAARQVPVIDLEAVFLDLAPKAAVPCFTDGIHFSAAGCQLTASLITLRLRELGLIKGA